MTPPTTFGVLRRPYVGLPGSIRSGEKARWKSRAGGQAALLQERAHDLLGGARVGGRLQHDQRAGRRCAATVSAAPITAPRSGPPSSSSGVGTQITTVSAVGDDARRPWSRGTRCASIAATSASERSSTCEAPRVEQCSRRVRRRRRGPTTRMPARDGLAHERQADVSEADDDEVPFDRSLGPRAHSIAPPDVRRSASMARVSVRRRSPLPRTPVARGTRRSCVRARCPAAPPRAPGNRLRSRLVGGLRVAYVAGARRPVLRRSTGLAQHDADSRLGELQERHRACRTPGSPARRWSPAARPRRRAPAVTVPT